MEWNLFWTAVSAIGTIFVGLVAVGITVWQTYLQYRSKVKLDAGISTIIAGLETDKPISCTYIQIKVTNIGNDAIIINTFNLSYKKDKKLMYAVENPTQQTIAQKYASRTYPTRRHANWKAKNRLFLYFGILKC